MSDVPQFWHVSYPVDLAPTNADGCTVYAGLIGRDEPDARLIARVWSRGRHAVVTNREGLVATYVNGEQWFSAAPPTER